MSKKLYYVQGVDELHQMVETPASKERTEFKRFIINIAISTVSAIAAIVAAVVTIMAYINV